MVEWRFLAQHSIDQDLNRGRHLCLSAIQYSALFPLLVEFWISVYLGELDKVLLDAGRILPLKHAYLIDYAGIYSRPLEVRS